jgi:hypothetical protein
VAPKRVREDPSHRNIECRPSESDRQCGERNGDQHCGEWIKERILEMGRRRPVRIGALSEGHRRVVQQVEVGSELRVFMGNEVQHDAGSEDEEEGSRKVNSSVGASRFINHAAGYPHRE